MFQSQMEAHRRPLQIKKKGPTACLLLPLCGGKVHTNIPYLAWGLDKTAEGTRPKPRDQVSAFINLAFRNIPVSTHRMMQLGRCLCPHLGRNQPCSMYLTEYFILSMRFCKQTRIWKLNMEACPYASAFASASGTWGFERNAKNYLSTLLYFWPRSHAPGWQQTHSELIAKM